MNLNKKTERRKAKKRKRQKRGYEWLGVVMSGFEWLQEVMGGNHPVVMGW